MQNYTTIIGVLEMRENNFSYRDCRARYDIGQGTVKLIIDRFQQLGLPLSDLKTMEPEKVEQSFYPPENIRRKDVPLPDYQRVYDRLFQKGSKQNLFYIWVEYKKEHTDGYQYTQFVHYFHEFVKKNYASSKLSMAVERMPGEKVYIDWIGDKPYLLVDTRLVRQRPFMFLLPQAVSATVFMPRSLRTKKSTASLPERYMPLNTIRLCQSIWYRITVKRQ